MININLLGEDTAIDHSAKLLLGGFILSLVACAGLFAALYSSVAGEVSVLTEKRDTLQGELDKLLERTKEVQELDKKKKLLQEKITLIARLKKSKIGPVRVLDDLNTAVPSKVWLRELEEKNNQIKIRGRAHSNQDVALFMKNLQTSDYFEAVDVVETRQMYYQKSTGMVTETPELEKTADFESDRRATRETRGGQSGVGVKDPDGELRRNTLLNLRREEALDKGGLKGDSVGAQGTRRGLEYELRSAQENKKTQQARESGRTRAAEIAEKNVKIKEFVLSAKVRYAGKLGYAFPEAEGKPGQPGGMPNSGMPPMARMRN